MSVSRWVITLFCMVAASHIKPRHPKGSHKGGQWAPGQIAADATADEMLLASETTNEPLPNKVVIRYTEGPKRQRTIKPRKGVWQLPALWSSSVARRLNEGEPSPTLDEMFDVAEIVLTEQLANQQIDPDPECVEQIQWAAWRGAYHKVINDTRRNKLRYIRDLLTMHLTSSKYDRKSPFIIAVIMAELRGTELNKEMNLYGHDHCIDNLYMDNFLIELVGRFVYLYPFSQELHNGANDMNLQQLLNRKLPFEPISHITVMEYIKELSEDAPVDADDDDTTEPIMNLCCYILASTSAEETLHQDALECVDSLLLNEQARARAKALLEDICQWNGCFADQADYGVVGREDGLRPEQTIIDAFKAHQPTNPSALFVNTLT